MVSYAIERFKKINAMSNMHINGNLSFARRFYLYVDLIFSILYLGCGITDYFQYQFIKRSYKERKTFIVHRKRMWLVRTFNGRGKKYLFDHKPSFNKAFNEYLGRPWLDMAEASFDQFSDFVSKTGKLLVKPAEGSHGRGIRVMEIENCQYEKVFNELRSEGVLLEELIDQHQSLAEFNPSSVNTIRVVTLLVNGRVNVMTANLRLGNGKDRFADNFHHNGIAALLDVDSGKVVTPGVDKNLNYYSVHPLSGKEITGFTVPCWNQVVDLVKKAALVVPDVFYVGWDLAVGSDDRVMLVEGNAAADPDISQMPDQIGKWPLFREVIEKIEAKSY